MNVLALMQGRAVAAVTTSQMKTAVEQGKCQALSNLVGFIATDQQVDLLGDEAANRRLAPSGQNFHLTNRFSVQMNRNLLFHCPIPVKR